jgi:hypothetical protein
MTRALPAAFVVITAAGGLALVAHPALAATLCVGSGHGCYPTIQAAVNAAQDGDTITIEPGTFAGGVTITTSVHLQGAGSASTIIHGGASVLTIGTFGASSEPTVSISGVTITGGVARSSPESVPFLGVDGAWAAGGGIEIPPNASQNGGATVTISDSVITGNRADPTTGVPSGITCPGSFPMGQCPFAPALGGGIDSWGTLTLASTTVSDNSVGSSGLASDADGAGIYSDQGSLTLIKSLVSGNRAVAAAPNGRYAEGGGINVGFPFAAPSGTDAVTVMNSIITGNSASLASHFPSFFGGMFQDLTANTGGMLVNSGAPTTVENTSVTDNSATASDLSGEPSAIDGGMSVFDGPLVMSGSVISGNRAITESATSADVGGAGTALEADGGGSISTTRITGNISTMVSPDGAAAVTGTLGVFGNTSLLTVRNSIISGNTETASSTTGQATVQGAGVFNDGLLALIADQVSDNSGTATAPAGTAQGAGIWNGTEYTGPPVQLNLENTTVTRNSLAGNSGVTVQGGGLFTMPPATLTLTHSLIALNIPDQCSGCASSAAGLRGQPARSTTSTAREWMAHLP